MMPPETEHAVYERCGQRVRVVTRADYTGTAGTPRAGLRRMHLFASPSGREEQCGGPGYCVECNREAEPPR
jgi:hypothetical protein